MDTRTDMTISPLVDVKTWRDAVCLIIDRKTKNSLCFSSGEITREIRIDRPDLHFSHWDIGEYVRDLYYSGAIGDGEYVQDDAYTKGISRSPSGSKVFVYGPSYEDTSLHTFEVDIPRATSKKDSSYEEYGTHALEGAKRSDNPYKAKVHKDNRLCIPRAPFEQFARDTGKKLGFGDKVHISLDKAFNKIKVRLQSDDNSKAYDLTKDRGRVKFKPDHGDDFCKWVSGDSFDVEVTEEGLDIQLNESVKV